MKRDERPRTVHPPFETSPEFPPPSPSGIQQEIGDRKAEAKRIVKRLAVIVEDHRQAAIPLNFELGADDISLVLDALREHARGGPRTPVPGARDEIQDRMRRSV